MRYPRKVIKEALAKIKKSPVKLNGEDVGKVTNWFFRDNKLWAKIRLDNGQEYQVSGLEVSDIVDARFFAEGNTVTIKYDRNI